MSVKTSEQIADEIMADRGGFRSLPDYSMQGASRSDVRAAIRDAIEIDRRQWFDTAGSASSQHYIDTGRYMLYEEVAEMEAINSPAECDYCDNLATGKNDDGENVCDEHAPVVIPEEEQCDECEEEATNFWPNLAKPVKLCDSCEHNARRSGWEPGQ